MHQWNSANTNRRKRAVKWAQSKSIPDIIRGSIHLDTVAQAVARMTKEELKRFLYSMHTSDDVIRKVIDSADVQYQKGAAAEANVERIIRLQPTGRVDRASKYEWVRKYILNEKIKDEGMFLAMLEYYIEKYSGQLKYGLINDLAAKISDKSSMRDLAMKISDEIERAALLYAIGDVSEAAILRVKNGYYMQKDRQDRVFYAQMPYTQKLEEEARAVRDITDMDYLVELAKTHPRYAARKEAIRKINDYELLERLATDKSVSYLLRCEAISRLTNQKILKGLAADVHDVNDVRAAAISQVEDTQFAVDLFESTNESKIAREALKRTSSHYRAMYSLSKNSLSLMKTAVQSLDDEQSRIVFDIYKDRLCENKLPEAEKDLQSRFQIACGRVGHQYDESCVCKVCGVQEYTFSMYVPMEYTSLSKTSVKRDVCGRCGTIHAYGVKAVEEPCFACNNGVKEFSSSESGQGGLTIGTCDECKGTGTQYRNEAYDTVCIE